MWRDILTIPHDCFFKARPVWNGDEILGKGCEKAVEEGEGRYGAKWC